MTRSVCVVITARASYARIKTLLIAIRERSDLELQLVVAGSALLGRYGSVIDVIQKDGFEINAEVYMVVEGGNLITSAKSTGMAIIELAPVFERLKPSIVITVADRYETIATAIASTYLNIPVAHVQGGEVTGSIDEKVRHAVTKLSTIHFVSTQIARERVIKMGELPEYVFFTGCPSIDLAYLVDQNGGYLTKDDLKTGVGAVDPQVGDHIVVLQHPVTLEWETAHDQIVETFEAVSSVDKQTFWFWPNIDAGSESSSKALREFREKGRSGKIRFMRNLRPESFLELINSAMCLVGNSSVGIREAAFLGVPVVNIGTRQDGRERANNVIDVGHSRDRIREAIDTQIKHRKYESSELYGDGKAGERIAKLIAESDLPIEKRLAY
ncbi:MAG: UDP-N-acetylglucosamine 2-epimerase [Candidatus Poribacteria bacterium]|nr:UDP-N-acetylglucosamine 2-epimerase [Candidatus Poribacteria bacterium]